MKTPPSQAASLAATQAFLANRASVGNLSNAAAAAALRSHVTTPTPVGQTQTKRMQRRGSVSSNGSAPERPGLLRRTSSGSMTERTFREPSPNRPASSHGPYTRVDEPPPVPALPKNIPHTPSSMPAQQRAARRAASVEPPERVSSPPPRIVGGRGASLDRGPGNYKPNGVAAKARINTLDSVGELDRTGNRNSVNFSRPMSPQNSPPISPMTTGRVRSPPPAKSTGVAAPVNGEAEGGLGSVQEAAIAPVKKKKKAAKQIPTNDSNVAQGTTVGASQAAATENTHQRQSPSVTSVQSPDTVTLPNGKNELPRPKKKKKKIVPAGGFQAQDAGEAFGSAYPSDTDSVTSERSSTTDRSRNFTTRAAGLLMKQPSVVREDREAEEQEESLPPPKIENSNGKVAQKRNSNMTTPANSAGSAPGVSQHTKTTSQVHMPKGPQRTSLDVPGAGRYQSLSPPRSTHFSSKPEYENPDGLKHQPPERSVSPAKSALKHSPSRGHSPIGGLPSTRRAGLVASEASDTASNISDEGSRSAPKKKKSVRVSFDDDAVAVGRAASPSMSPDSPVIMSPQTKPKNRSWYDLIRENKQGEVIDDTDQDGVIKPTPTLPSFGSIRRERNDGPAIDVSENRKPTEDSVQTTLRSIDSSSDHLVGSLLAQDAATKPKEQGAPRRGPNEPLPPEVTSVEGSGYHSDEEVQLFDDQQNAGNPPVLADSAQTASAKDAAFPAETSSEDLTTLRHDASVPSIALQPATPALESPNQNQKGWLGTPGGFSDATVASENIHRAPTPLVDADSPEATPATVGLAEPEPEAVAALHDPASPHIGSVAEGLRTQIESHSGDESEDSGASIYSDAAEDPDDLEGDGFGSINAIVESPAPSPTGPVAGRAAPADQDAKARATQIDKPSPLTRKESELSEPASDEGWDRAQAYWSGLSQERRRQLEHAAVPGALDERVIPNKTMRGPDSVKKKKKKVPKKSSPSPVASDAPDTKPNEKYSKEIATQAQPTAPPLKSSLRNSQVGNAADQRMPSSLRNPQLSDSQEPHIHTSMRGGPPKSALRGSSQKTPMQPPSEPRGTLQKKTRPVSAVAMGDYGKSQAAPASSHIRASSAALPPTSTTPVLAQPKKKAPAKKPPLRRNDSGSSSSFKKERPSTAASGKYTMKRTMRPSSIDSRTQSPAANRASSMTARTSSPAESTGRRPFSTVGPGGGGMRTSMRGSMDTSKPAARTSLRESMDSKRTKSPSRFGFGKSSKPKSTESQPNSRISSRFGDSSDEEDFRPTASSRFADSSDDEPADFTPVRGIPRRIDEGDSTDLEDSSVDNAPTSSKPKVNGANPPSALKPEGLALATGSLRVPSGDNPVAAMGTGLQAKKAVEKDKKKRSFFGGLGSKKRAESSEARDVTTEPTAKVGPSLKPLKIEGTPTKGAARSERVLGPSSPTADPVSLSERPIIGSRTSSAQNSPKSPKLQRRNTPKTVPKANDISWPLPQRPGENTGAPGSRPQTSDGAAAGTAVGRPDVGERRTTVQGPPHPDAPPVVGKTDKKKRFGMLRKALGMQN